MSNKIKSSYNYLLYKQNLRNVVYINTNLYKSELNYRISTDLTSQFLHQINTRLNSMYSAER